MMTEIFARVEANPEKNLEAQDMGDRSHQGPGAGCMRRSMYWRLYHSQRDVSCFVVLMSTPFLRRLA